MPRLEDEGEMIGRPSRTDGIAHANLVLGS